MTLSAAIMKEVLDQKIKMKSIELATTDMDMKEVSTVSFSPLHVRALK